MSVPLQWYLGRFYLPAHSPSISGNGSSSIPTSAGYYYLRGAPSCGATGYLMEHFQLAITSVGGGGYASATVAIDATTGIVTLDFSGCASNVAIAWGSATGLRDLLGFAGDLSGAKVYTAAHAARYQWRPTQPLVNAPGGDLSIWFETAARSLVHRSGSGSISTTRRSPIYDCEIEYALLTKAESVLSVDKWESFAQFFADVAAVAQPVRCYPDRTDVATFFESIIVGEGAEASDEGIGAIRKIRQPSFQQWDQYWNVRFGLFQYLVAS